MCNGEIGVCIVILGERGRDGDDKLLSIGVIVVIVFFVVLVIFIIVVVILVCWY